MIFATSVLPEALGPTKININILQLNFFYFINYTLFSFFWQVINTIQIKRISQYLYEASFITIPQEIPNISEFWGFGGCSFVDNGKLYLNFDSKYNENISFHIYCPDFEGIAFIDGATNQNISDELVSQLPYHIVNGTNSNGIMIASNMIYNDWDIYSDGNIPLTKLPYLVLNNVKSIDTIYDDLNEILTDLYIPQSSEKLIQILITDSINTFILRPDIYNIGSYELVEISDNAKLSNFYCKTKRQKCQAV